MRPLHEQKVLLLHPFLNYYGGAEYLLSVVAKDISNIPEGERKFTYIDEIAVKDVYQEAVELLPPL